MVYLIYSISCLWYIMFMEYLVFGIFCLWNISSMVIFVTCVSGMIVGDKYKVYFESKSFMETLPLSSNFCFNKSLVFASCNCVFQTILHHQSGSKIFFALC